MSKSTECEPYLNDYMSNFRSIFIPLDKSLNTSEIKPLHLAVPRNRQGVRTTTSNTGGQSASPSRLSANNNETSDDGTKNSNQNNTDKKPTRFLTNRYLNQNDSSKTGKDSNSKPKDSSTASVYKGIEEVAQKILPKNQSNSDNTNRNTEEPPRQSRPKPSSQLSATTQNDKEVIEMLIRNEDYWYLPLAQSIIIRLIFSVYTVSSKFVFELFIEGDDVPLMSAEMIGQSRADGINISVKDKLIGETHYTPGNSSLFAGLTINDQKDEACAAIFNPSFSSVSQPRVFDFLVPALKKINGRSRMLPIPLDESSGLVARLSQMSKEAIRLKTRIPASQDNSFDMTFDGKFKQSSLSNFILYHDSNTRKDLCTLGMISEGHYLLEIGYPLSPIQGFLAAISASSPI